MKKILAIAILAVVIMGCSGENPSQIYREFKTQSKIEFQTGYVDDETQIPIISTGENLVFKYTFAHEEEEDIADDEHSEIFYFEVANGTTSFIYDSTEPESNEAIIAGYRRLCFCGFESYTLKKAVISTQKLNNTQWQVSFDVVFAGQYGSYPLKDSGTYKVTTGSL